jgi:LysM repeat protein
LVLLLLALPACRRSLQPNLPEAPTPAAQLDAGGGIDLAVPNDGLEPGTGVPGDAAAPTDGDQPVVPDSTGGESAPVDTSPVPADGDSSTVETPGDSAELPTPTGPRENVVYIVKSGDILGFIAEAYDVSTQDIIAANNLINPNSLEVGQELIIPLAGLDSIQPDSAPADGGDQGSTTPDPADDIIHIVQAGETLFRIGLRYGVPYEEIAAYNGLPDPTDIDVGQQIRIPRQ